MVKELWEDTVSNENLKKPLDVKRLLFVYKSQALEGLGRPNLGLPRVFGADLIHGL